MDYGAIIWDPYLQQDADKLERVQRQAARFITQDYKTRETGCITHMLKTLELDTLKTRRKNQKLVFLYKVVEGLIPAILPEDFLTSCKTSRRIKPKKFYDCETTNVVDKLARNNSKCFVIPNSKTAQFKNSYFVDTLIIWNQLEDSVVSAPSLESFRTALTKFQ